MTKAAEVPKTLGKSKQPILSDELLNILTEALRWKESGDGNIFLEAMLSMTTKKTSAHKSKAKILVVDDEPQVAETLREILILKSFDVETAENGQQAIELVRSGEHFDLVITDMKMPGIDGLELLKLIRQVRESLPVIILTGHGTVENALRSIEEGACDYVLKPFMIEDLMTAVARGISKSRPDLE